MPNGSNELSHSGRKGMKWGTRNGPPYPLSRQARFKEGFESYNKNLKPSISRTGSNTSSQSGAKSGRPDWELHRENWVHHRRTRKDIDAAREKLIAEGYLEPPKPKKAIRSGFAARRASKKLDKYEKLRSVYKGKMRDIEAFNDFAKDLDNPVLQSFKRQGAMTYGDAKAKYGDYSQKIDKILNDLKDSGYDVSSEEAFRDPTHKGREKKYHNALEWEKMGKDSRLVNRVVSSNKYTVKKNKNHTLRGKASSALDNITPVANYRLESKLQKVAKSQYRSQRNMRFKDDPQRFVDKINEGRPDNDKYKDYLDYTRKTAKTPKLANTLTRRYKLSQASANLAVQTNAKQQKADEDDLKDYVSSLQNKGYKLSARKVQRDPYAYGAITTTKHYDYMGRPTNMDSMRIRAKKKKKKKT